MSNLEIGRRYKVKVVRIIRVGVLVDLEDGSTNLIHVSKISNDFVSNPAHFVSVGDEYEAEAVAGSARDIELSLRHLELHSKRPNNVIKYDDKPKETPYQKDRRSHTHDKTITPTATQKPSTPSLDEMIASCNRTYEDKFGKGSLNSSGSRNRNRRRP